MAARTREAHGMTEEHFAHLLAMASDSLPLRARLRSDSAASSGTRPQRIRACRFKGTARFCI